MHTFCFSFSSTLPIPNFFFAKLRTLFDVCTILSTTSTSSVQQYSSLIFNSTGLLHSSSPN